MGCDAWMGSEVKWGTWCLFFLYRLESSTCCTVHEQVWDVHRSVLVVVTTLCVTYHSCYISYFLNYAMAPNRPLID